MAVPNMADIFNYIKQEEIRLNKCIMSKIELLKKSLDTLSTSYVLSNPLASFEIKEQKLDSFITRLNQTIQYRLINAQSRFDSIKKNHILLNPNELFMMYHNTLELYINKLELLNPLNVLGKGYSITKKGNEVIKSSKQLKKKDLVNIKLLDGTIDAIVEGVK